MEPTTSLDIVSLIVTNHYDLDFHTENTNDGEPAAEHARKIACVMPILTFFGTLGHFIISSRTRLSMVCFVRLMNSHCTNRAVTA